MKSYEEAIERAGRFGLYQKRFFLVYYISTLISPMVVLCGVFVVYSPSHRCFIPQLDNGLNLTKTDDDLPPVSDVTCVYYSNLSRPSDILCNFIPLEKGADGNVQWSKCNRYKNDDINNNVSLPNRSIIKCDQGWKYFVPAGVVSATIEFDLVCDDSWLKPLVVSIEMFGFMMGSLVGGILSDKFGRYFAVMFNWVVLGISLLLAALLPVWIPTYISWFFAGFAVIAKTTSGIILINEWTPLKYRHAAGMMNIFMFAFRNMLVAPIAYLLPNWRHLLLTFAAMQLVLAVPLFFFANESWRWLLRNKKYHKIDNLIKEVARVNKRSLDGDNELLDQRDDGTQKNNDLTNENETGTKDLNKTLTYIDLLKIPFLRKRLFIFGLGWFTTVLSYHGMSINTNNIGGNRYLTSFINGVVEIPGFVLCYFSTRKLGGRRSFVLMTGIAGLFLLLTPLASTIADWAVIPCAMTGKLFISGSFAILYLFTGDLFPTLLRNQAYGASSFVSRFAGILIPYILYLGTNVFKAIPYLIMGGIAMSAAIAMSFLPETKNKPMPDTIEEAKLQEKSSRGLFCCVEESKHKPDVEHEQHPLENVLT